MSAASVDVVRNIYDAFGRGDVPAILAALGEDIEWHAPENLPHGGEFRGRDAVGRFFAGIGENWQDLTLEIEDLLSGDERVVVLARIRGELRATGEQTGYTAAHAWTVRDGTPVRFDEYVNAPLTLPSAGAAAG
jgi:ketosteroid isomerase-like protein